MPNLKLFVDRATGAEAVLQALLPALRDLACARLAVGPEACQMALVAVGGLPDQPPVNVEIQLLPGPARSTAALRALAQALQGAVREASGLHAAVRIASLDPATYVVLK